MATKKVFAYDVTVIGSGSAGFAAAEAATRDGAKVCLIEGGKLGGECPNDACIPTKSLIRSALHYDHTRRSLADFGVHVAHPTFRFPEMMARKQAVIDVITGKGKRLAMVAKELGIDLVRGRATFLDDHTLQVGSCMITSDHVVLAVGSVDAVPPIPGLLEQGFWSYKDAVSAIKVPQSLVIIGGGPVGCEIATIFSCLGTSVTIIQLDDHLLQREDAEIASLAQGALEDRGVAVHVGTRTIRVEPGGPGKTRVVFADGDNPARSVTASKVLLAAGKRPNIDGLGLERVGVRLDARGHIIHNASLQTTAKHIFVAGDASGGLMFTHTAHVEGSIAGRNAVASTRSKPMTADFSVVPRVTFVEPEVASVGMTPAEAGAAQRKIIVGAFPVGALGRAVADGRRQGLIKLVADAKTRNIIGGHMIGPHAGEVIHEVALAMYAGLTADDLANMIHAFPTYSEAIPAAASMMM